MTDFSIKNKLTSQSFNKQKGLIKRILLGKSTTCPECKAELELILPETKNTNKKPGIYCKKGCTDIELELEAVQ